MGDPCLLVNPERSSKELIPLQAPILVKFVSSAKRILLRLSCCPGNWQLHFASILTILYTMLYTSLLYFYTSLLYASGVRLN